MIWLFWNIRGVNKRYKQKELRNYIKAKKIKLAGIIETRVKEHKFQAISRNIIPRWEALNNYQYASNGRIWIVWDPNTYSISSNLCEPV